MPAYNFQKQFVDLIRAGIKHSTIRRSRTRGGNPQPGKPLQLYNGMRTSSCEKIIADPICKSVRPIVIWAEYFSRDSWKLEIILEGEKLNMADIVDLARADGFEHERDFCEFFSRKYGDTANLYLIEW